MHRLLLVPLLLLAAALSGCAPAVRPEPAAGFVTRSVEVDGVDHAYQVFVPGQRREPLPVVLFLHGSGERGDDNRAQTEAGLGPYLRAHADAFPALVVFPQSPRGRSWDGDVARVALAALDAASREFGGDAARTYLTGMSRGGYGTWALALDHPQRFAALAPVCGGLTNPPGRDDLAVEAVAGAPDPFAAAASRLRGIPSWIFHGAQDDVVPPAQSRRMADALRAAGADVRYTEFPDANHNAWDPAYATPELWAWLFAQRLHASVP
ncbi:prolyl oligopeptidase family serine peptidase [Coralloluteibacterium stylophorae]|uniref:Prolyl oligopeptidase family serine peptidase n=1 Tax=Coralloluteibacterium stylophorae TaxID=1776034 RepID=A0A8J7VVH3_9GAMM|nr:prolyl oligopeptidase family serine peptidase [Coralloluteibacterium stylophorae]MBS7456750.1 prolyl oligopeptidase family serine peptidase [Coralloluteibacterium stylophorae]